MTTNKLLFEVAVWEGLVDSEASADDERFLRVLGLRIIDTLERTSCGSLRPNLTGGCFSIAQRL